MTDASARSNGTGLRLRQGLALLLVALGLFLLAREVTFALLLHDAGRERGALARDGGALRWSFADADDLVLAGSAGLVSGSVQRERDGVSFTFADDDVDLSLPLRARGLPLTALTQATLRLRSPQALDARLIVATAAGRLVEGERVRYEGSGAPITLDLPLPPHDGDALATALRVHLTGRAGTTAQVDRLDLFAVEAAALTCVGERDIARTLAACGRGPGALQAPPFLLPESLLAYRDAIRAQSLAWVMPARGSAWLAARISSAQLSPAFAIARLTLLAVVVVLLLAWRRRGDAAQALHPAQLLVLLPAVLLLGLGFPGEGAVAREGAVLGWLGAAMLLARRAPDWRWVGDATTWRAAARWGAWSLLPVLALALVNALDGDGLQLRWPAVDRFWRYPLWALLQQWLLIEVIAPRMRTLFATRPAAAMAAGALFALLHLPNAGLMLLTLFAGSAWAGFGLRYRALWPLVASHAVLGLLVVVVAPPWLLRSAEVGGRFLLAP